MTSLVFATMYNYLQYMYIPSKKTHLNSNHFKTNINIIYHKQIFFLLLKMWMQIGKKWMHFNNVNLTLQPILFLMKNINM